MRGSWYRRDGNDMLLFLKIQPRSSKDEFAEVMEDLRKVRLKAPPVEGKANTHLVKYLAKLFKVPKASVVVESGLTSRSKRVRILNTEHLPESILAK